MLQPLSRFAPELSLFVWHHLHHGNFPRTSSSNQGAKPRAMLLGACHHAYKKLGTDVMHYENVDCIQIAAVCLCFVPSAVSFTFCFAERISILLFFVLTKLQPKPHPPQSDDGMASTKAPDKIPHTDHHKFIFDFSKSFSSRRKATLANDLPHELLVYIFETAQNMLLPSEHLFRRFPFILGGVSRYWRQVAFTAPKLWLNVDISHPRDLTALRGYLDRSKDYPIELHLSYDNALTEEVIFFDAEVTQLIDILQPHYSRCRSINFLGTCPEPAPEMEMMKILRSMSNSRYPMLKRFLVQLPEMGDEIRPRIFGYDAQNLTSVFLRGLGLSYCRPPLNAVTELHLAMENNTIDGGDFFEMLRACAKSLITLCTYDDLLLTWPARGCSIAMPCLRHLRTFGNMNEVSELLLLISAPDLEELTIAPIIWRDLSTLLLENPNNPKFPALKSLTLAPAHARAMGLALIYASACFPGITLLILPNYYKQSLRLSFLTEDDASRWPRLHSLAVRDIGGRYDESALYDLVKDRQRLGAPLRTLYVDSLSVSRMTRMDWLKDQLTVVEADLWEIQRRGAFYNDEGSRFIGSERES